MTAMKNSKGPKKPGKVKGRVKKSTKGVRVIKRDINDVIADQAKRQREWIRQLTPLQELQRSQRFIGLGPASQVQQIMKTTKMFHDITTSFGAIENNISNVLDRQSVLSKAYAPPRSIEVMREALVYQSSLRNMFGPLGDMRGKLASINQASSVFKAPEGAYKMLVHQGSLHDMLATRQSAMENMLAHQERLRKQLEAPMYRMMAGQMKMSKIVLGADALIDNMLEQQDKIREALRIPGKSTYNLEAAYGNILANLKLDRVNATEISASFNVSAEPDGKDNLESEVLDENASARIDLKVDNNRLKNIEILLKEIKNELEKEKKANYKKDITMGVLIAIIVNLIMEIMAMGVKELLFLLAFSS